MNRHLVRIPCMTKAMSWPTAFDSYMPLNHKVYGCICISENNKILLVKGRNSRKWSFPKGHRDRTDRSALDCALRELHEETGLRLHKDYIGTKKYRVAEYYIYSVPEEYRLFPIDDKEIEEAQWFCVDDIKDLNKNVDVSMFCHHLENKVLV